MTQLEQQANEYAHEIMRHYPPCKNWKIPVIEQIAEAYEQGWIDRDTRDMKPETEEEFFKWRIEYERGNGKIYICSDASIGTEMDEGCERYRH